MHAILGFDSMPLLAQEASATYLRYITGGGVVGYVIVGLSVIAVALGLAQLLHLQDRLLVHEGLFLAHQQQRHLNVQRVKEL